MFDVRQPSLRKKTAPNFGAVNFFCPKRSIEFVSVFGRVSKNLFAAKHARNFAFALHELCADNHVQMPDSEEDYKPGNVMMNIMQHHLGTDERIDPAEEHTARRRGICHIVHSEARQNFNQQ